MQTKEELNAFKDEVETLNMKLAELDEEELEQVAGGGFTFNTCPKCGNKELIKDDAIGIYCERCGLHIPGERWD